MKFIAMDDPIIPRTRQYIYKYGRRFKSEDDAERWRQGAEILKPPFTEEELAKAKELVDAGYKSVSNKYRTLLKDQDELTLSLREFAAFKKVARRWV